MRHPVVPIFVICIFVSCVAPQSEADSAVNVKETSVPLSPEDAGTTVIEEAVSKLPCPADMVYVNGEFCTNLEEICLNWLDKPVCLKTDPKTKNCLDWSTPLRCGEFKYPTVCKGKTKHMNFCIDRYEYPNQLGVKPQLLQTWINAKSQCEKQSKRLCIDNEWTQACRGPENLPYPYGYKRDATACRIDLPWQDPAKHTFEELDKTVPAGSMPACVSYYGAHDMTGNGDEWAQSSGGTPYISVLVGGHAYGVRNRCSPRTTGHSPDFSYYDTGFRCCKDVP